MGGRAARLVGEGGRGDTIEALGLEPLPRAGVQQSIESSFEEHITLA